MKGSAGWCDFQDPCCRGMAREKRVKFPKPQSRGEMGPKDCCLYVIFSFSLYLSRIGTTCDIDVKMIKQIVLLPSWNNILR